MIKSPISVLQEHVVQQKMPFPIYEITDCGIITNPAFECTVSVGDKKACGLASTKKQAKHNAAGQLLELLGIKMGVNTREISNICLLPQKARKLNSLVINFVGKLNEFCSGNKLQQAEYIESVMAFNEQFCITCRFLEFSTRGFGNTKKDAKQDAARKMLLEIKDKDVGQLSVEANPIDSVDQLDKQENLDKILETYTEIMKNMSISKPELNNNSLQSPFLQKKELSITTWQELINFVSNQGWRYNISVFQQVPLMMRLQINDFTFLNFGANIKEIQEKFTKTIVALLEEDMDFTKPLFK